MNKFKKVVAVISVIAGIFFLLNTKSDIQLGTGMILVVLGILGNPSEK